MSSLHTNSYMSSLYTNSYMSRLHTNSYISCLRTNSYILCLHTNSYISCLHTIKTLTVCMSGLHTNSHMSSLHTNSNVQLLFIVLYTNLYMGYKCLVNWFISWTYPKTTILQNRLTWYVIRLLREYFKFEMLCLLVTYTEVLGKIETWTAEVTRQVQTIWWGNINKWSSWQKTLCREGSNGWGMETAEWRAHWVTTVATNKTVIQTISKCKFIMLSLLTITCLVY